MTIANTITVAQEAQEYIEQGSASINAMLPDRVLVYLARRYVESLERASRREQVRKIEREVAVAIRRTPEEVEADIARKARRKAWEAVLGKSFALNGGEEATWGEATKSQHLARANAQRKHAKAAEDDARLHELALNDLSRFEVNCLAEL